MGSDIGADEVVLNKLQFQSTLPRGERPMSIGVMMRLKLFQSTLPRGERRQQSYRVHPPQQFQSTLPRGERLSFIDIFFDIAVNFNPRSRVGSDCEPIVSCRLHSGFQSTLPRGERLDFVAPIQCFTYFNPRSRVGSDYQS